MSKVNRPGSTYCAQDPDGVWWCCSYRAFNKKTKGVYDVIHVWNHQIWLMPTAKKATLEQQARCAVVLLAEDDNDLRIVEGVGRKGITVELFRTAKQVREPNDDLSTDRRSVVADK